MTDVLLFPKRYMLHFETPSGKLIAGIMRNGQVVIGEGMTVEEAAKESATLFFNKFAEQLTSHIKGSNND